MILIPEFKTYLAEKKEQLPLVNFCRAVVKEEEVTRFLQQVKASDNQIMMGIMPDARSTARDEDNIKMNNATGFLFLEKTDYGADKYDQWMDVFQRTQESAVAFVRQIIQDKSFGNCDFVQYLDLNNISLEPVSGLGSCSGWIVEVYFDTPF